MNVDHIPQQPAAGLDLGTFEAILARSLAHPARDDADRLAPMIEWAQSVAFPDRADAFAREAIWVICCSGMKFAVARLIQERVWTAIHAGEPVSSRFGHKGKAQACDTIWRERERLYGELVAAHDRLAYLQTLPWIGGITKYHLAKNIGVDCAKPDVHLQRLAKAAGTSVDDLCARLARESGYRIATVDLILWYACAHGIVDSREDVPWRIAGRIEVAGGSEPAFA